MAKSESICEEKVFDQVYKTHVKALYNFIYYKCKDSSKSQDFVQESFIKLWDNCAKVIFNKAKSYLFTIANNLFLNAVKHDKVKQNHQNSVSTANSTNENPEFIFETNEFNLKLNAAINNLSPEQREVFLLNRIDKKKYREIAELLQISVKTVEKRMSLALKQLHSSLKIDYKI